MSGYVVVCEQELRDSKEGGFQADVAGPFDTYEEAERNVAMVESDRDHDGNIKFECYGPHRICQLYMPVSG